MYYILKERWIIKHFAVIPEALLSEWDTIRAKPKFPKTAFMDIVEEFFHHV
jgi:hypothetical protein